MAKVGARVGAMLSAGDGVVNFLGFGTYEGDEIPPKEVGGLAAELGLPNPKIKLDNGAIIWGCQCWWGSEEGMKAKLEQYKVAGYKIQDISM